MVLVWYVLDILFYFRNGVLIRLTLTAWQCADFVDIGGLKEYKCLFWRQMICLSQNQRLISLISIPSPFYLLGLNRRFLQESAAWAKKLPGLAWWCHNSQDRDRQAWGTDVMSPFLNANVWIYWSILGFLEASSFACYFLRSFSFWLDITNIGTLLEAPWRLTEDILCLTLCHMPCPMPCHMLCHMPWHTQWHMRWQERVVSGCGGCMLKVGFEGLWQIDTKGCFCLFSQGLHVSHQLKIVGRRRALAFQTTIIHARHNRSSWGISFEACEQWPRRVQFPFPQASDSFRSSDVCYL